MHAPKQLPEPRGESIHVWLKEIYLGVRGFELGGVNSSLLAVILKRQLMKWESLALGYTADIVMLTHTFVVDVVCPVERVRVGVVSLLMDHLIEQYKWAH